MKTGILPGNSHLCLAGRDECLLCLDEVQRFVYFQLVVIGDDLDQFEEFDRVRGVGDSFIG